MPYDRVIRMQWNELLISIFTFCEARGVNGYKFISQCNTNSRIWIIRWYAPAWERSRRLWEVLWSCLRTLKPSPTTSSNRKCQFYGHLSATQQWNLWTVTSANCWTGSKCCKTGWTTAHLWSSGSVASFSPTHSLLVCYKILQEGIESPSIQSVLNTFAWRRREIIAKTQRMECMCMVCLWRVLAGTMRKWRSRSRLKRYKIRQKMSANKICKVHQIILTVLCSGLQVLHNIAFKLVMTMLHLEFRFSWRYCTRRPPCCGCSRPRCQRNGPRHATCALCIEQRNEGACWPQLGTPPILCSTWRCPLTVIRTIGCAVGSPCFFLSVTNEFSAPKPAVAHLLHPCCSCISSFDELGTKFVYKVVYSAGPSLTALSE